MGYLLPADLLPMLLKGVWITLRLTAGGALLALVMAWLSGLGRLSRFRLVRAPASLYIEIFRGTSALVQLYWFYFALPLLGVRLTAMTAGILVLGLNIGSYGAEVVRGCIQAVPKGQREAALALNFGSAQRMWLVIAPQAIPAMLPPAGNLLIELLKSTALVSLITLSDLTFQADVLRAETLRTTEIYGIVLLIYYVIAKVMIAGNHWLERRVNRAMGVEVRP